MAAWARKVARDPNATTPADIQALRDSGPDDQQIFAITAFAALRLAFPTINDSLGAQPDAQLAQSLPREVREAAPMARLQLSDLVSCQPRGILKRIGATLDRPL